MHDPMSLERFDVVSVPDKPFDRAVFLEAMGKESFMIMYDLESRSCSVVLDSLAAHIPGLISSTIAGLEFSKAGSAGGDAEYQVVSAYRGIESFPQSFMSEVFDIGLHGTMCIAFVPICERELSQTREYIERRLGGISVARGYSVSDSGVGRRTSTSVQHKDFASSDESSMLNEMLESLNRSIMANGTAYKVAFAASDHGTKEYLLQRMVELESHSVGTDMEGLLRHVKDMRGLAFGSDFASRLINFYGNQSVSYTLPASYAKSGGDIALGMFMKDSVHETANVVRIYRSLLNLGFVISGLPGSGKTREAMAVIDSVAGTSKGTMVVVISPTDEWNAFALSHGMSLVRLCEDRVPINLFKCPGGADVRRFYESLAMILSTASAAGPYRNPMEKCMLNAFRRVYAKTGAPDPIAVHREIEESIIRMHAKRTNTGVKYTKHGENIRSSLENLVAILQMPEYSERKGICIEELASGGIVFDISNAGVQTKAYFYALLLNQIYSIASSFDSNGDDELRLLVCLEEAQMVLRDQRSPVVEDLRSRIQDFRKKGVGLMLLAHSISDIELGIRRLCQLKIYLKQAPDVAEMAAGDLVFANVKDDAVASRLKHLDSRVGALSYMGREGNTKATRDTVFIKTIEYRDTPSAAGNPIDEYVRKRRISTPRSIKSSIIIGPMPESVAGMRMSYLGEELFEIGIDSAPLVFQAELVEGRTYWVELLDQRGRVVESRDVEAASEVRINGLVD